jgi:hypothetical protein
MQQPISRLSAILKQGAWRALWGFVTAVGLGWIVFIGAMVFAGGSGRAAASEAGLGASSILAAGFQLAGLFLGGGVQMDVGSALWSSSAATISMWVPLLIPAAVVGSAIVLVEVRGSRSLRRAVARGTTPAHLWQSASVTGGVLGLGATLIAMLFPVRLDVSLADVDVHANFLLTLVGGFIVGTAASALGQARASGRLDLAALGVRLRRNPLRLADLWTMTVHATFATALSLVVVVVALLVADPRIVPAVLIAGSSTIAMVLGTAHFGPMWLSSDLAEQISATGDGYVWGVRTLPWWGLVLLVLILVSAVGAAAVSGSVARTQRGLAPGRTWWRLPLYYAVAGAVCVFASMVYVGGIFDEGGVGQGVGEGGGNAWVMLAPVGVLIAAAWGAGVEAAIRYAGPVLFAALPPRCSAWWWRLTWRYSGPRALRTAGAAVAFSPDPASPRGVTPWAGAISGGATAAEQVPGGVWVPPAGGAWESAGSLGVAGSGQAVLPAPAPPAIPKMRPRQPMSPRKRRQLIGWAICAAAVALLAIGAGVAYSIVSSSVFGPQRVVGQYLDALESGDAAAAIAIADPSAPNEARALLTNEIYAKATGRPSSFEIISAEQPTKGRSTVEFTYDIGGVKGTRSMTLHAGPKAWLVFTTWQLDNPELGALSVNFPGVASEVLVNGVGVGVADGAGFAELAAYPGTYTVELPGTEYLDGQTATVSVGWEVADWSEETEATYLEYSPSAGLQEETQALVAQYSEACAQATHTESSEQCPFSAYAGSDVIGGQWEILTPPVIAVTLGSDAWVDVDGYAFYTQTPGSARFIGQGRGWSELVDLDETVEFSVEGGVMPAANGLTLVTSSGIEFSEGTVFPEDPPGTDDWGLTLPRATAEDQARYLAEILAKSAQERPNLAAALSEARELCAAEPDSPSAYSTQLDAIRGVIDNRRVLLDTLNLVPVGKLPDGDALMTALREAITSARTADTAYLDLAIDFYYTECGAESPDREEVDQHDAAASDAKQAFAELWNSTVAGPLGVPQLDPNSL